PRCARGGAARHIGRHSGNLPRTFTRRPSGRWALPRAAPYTVEAPPGRHRSAAGGAATHPAPTGDRTPSTDTAHPEALAARVVAVVVTYNREALLRECLDALAAQERRPDAVVVIDNSSTDASGTVADEHPLGADVVHLRRNVGGAGGFAAGIARALVRHDADWVWVMDDDTVPRPGALHALLSALEASPVRLSVLSSRAVWTDGRDHPMNTQRTRLGASAQEKRDAAQAGGRP